MKTLNITVNNKKATFSKRDGDIICGNFDYQIRFRFDSEWDAYEEKTARFIWNGKRQDVKFTGDVCPVPVITNADEVAVGVYVEQLATTTSAKIPCLRSILCGEEFPPSSRVANRTFTRNGVYPPYPGYDGYGTVTVDVPYKGTIDKQTKHVLITENGTTIVEPDPHEYADEIVLERVEIDVEVPTEIKGAIVPAGTYTLKQFAPANWPKQELHGRIIDLQKDAESGTFVEGEPVSFTSVEQHLGGYIKFCDGDNEVGSIMEWIDLESSSRKIELDETQMVSESFKDWLYLCFEKGIKTLSIPFNGLFDVTDYQRVDVDVPEKEISLEEKTITENGEYTASEGFDGIGKVVVNVPNEIPEGYIQPEGTKDITTNGTHNVAEYESVVVDVPNEIPEGYIQPSGEKEITENGTHDVTAFESVVVNVPSEGAGGGVILQAGTYNMVAYYYGSLYWSGWQNQVLGGTVVEGYQGDTTEKIFTSIDNDGEWCMCFKSDGGTVTEITPSWNADDYATKVIIHEAQIVSEEFKAWFDMCFEKEQSKSKLAQIADRTITEITAEDLAGDTKIGDYAFSYCKSLTSVAIPDGVLSIGISAFYECTGLTSITIPDGVTSIGNSAFAHCRKLESITIPDSVTSISFNVFTYCKSLTSVIIPNGVTSLETQVFDGCQNLTSITIPDSVTKIGNNTFGSCKSLASITIPHSVTSIDGLAFQNCSSLMSVTMEGDTPPTIQSTTFKGVPEDCIIYIKNPNAVEAYKTATNWSARADYIVAKGGTSPNISAGTYKFTEFIYPNDEHPDAFAWGTQEIHGRITVVGEVNAEGDFTTISNNGDYEVSFNNNGSSITSMYPYWTPSDYDTTIVFDEDQTVEETFKAWFDACFVKTM